MTAVVARPRIGRWPRSRHWTRPPPELSEANLLSLTDRELPDLR